MNNIEHKENSPEFVIFNCGDGWEAFEASYLEFGRLKRQNRKARFVEKGALIAFGYCKEHKNELEEMPGDEYHWCQLKFEDGKIYFDYSSGVCETAYYIKNCSDVAILSPQESNYLLQEGIDILRRILIGIEDASAPGLLLNYFPFDLTFLVSELETVRNAGFLIKKGDTIPTKSSDELIVEDNQTLSILADDNVRYPLALPTTFHSPIKIVFDIDANYKIGLKLDDFKSVNSVSYDLGLLIEERKRGI